MVGGGCQSLSDGPRCSGGGMPSQRLATREALAARQDSEDSEGQTLDRGGCDRVSPPVTLNSGRPPQPRTCKCRM